MGITVLCASVYMWYKKTEHFPFGMREVRPLLIARGLFGFFGVFGMYCKSGSNLVDALLVVLAARISNSRQRVTFPPN
jgi:hypothetical protein